MQHPAAGDNAQPNHPNLRDPWPDQNPGHYPGRRPAFYCAHHTERISEEGSQVAKDNRPQRAAHQSWSGRVTPSVLKGAK